MTRSPVFRLRAPVAHAHSVAQRASKERGASIPVGLRRGNSERLEGEDVHPSAETGRVQTPVFRAFLCTQVLAWGETPGDRDIGREAPRACRELPAFRAGCRP